MGRSRLRDDSIVFCGCPAPPSGPCTAFGVVRCNETHFFKLQVPRPKIVVFRTHPCVPSLIVLLRIGLLADHGTKPLFLALPQTTLICWDNVDQHWMLPDGPIACERLRPLDEQDAQLFEIGSHFRPSFVDRSKPRPALFLS